MEKEILTSLENESFVSLDVAELLKKNGFNLQCRNFYRKEDGEWFRRTTYEHNYFNTDVPRWEGCYACPTHQMVLKWLREEKELFVSVNPTIDKDGFVCVTYYIWKLDDIDEEAIRSGIYSVGNYDGCVDDAIKYCLMWMV